MLAKLSEKRYSVVEAFIMIADFIIRRLNLGKPALFPGGIDTRHPSPANGDNEMSVEDPYQYHFYQLSTRRAEQFDAKGLKKLSFISEELNTDLYVFLWIDEANEIDQFQFFFFEKVIDWSRKSGLTTNITNRLQSPDTEGKTGVRKGLRTLERVDDPKMLDEALEILKHSVFPLGIKDIIKMRISGIS